VMLKINGKKVGFSNFEHNFCAIDCINCSEAVAGRGKNHSFLSESQISFTCKDFIKNVFLLLCQSKGFLMCGEVER